MRSQSRLFWLGLAVCLLMSSYFLSKAHAAPAALDCRKVSLSAPSAGATVSGQVEIRGRALILDFQFYKVEYSPLASDDWLLIGTDVTKNTVENGRLTLWQTRLVPNGTYRLRLRVVDPTGNYCESIVLPIKVANSTVQPTEVPPEPTETPILTVVPPGPSPTPKLSVPIEIVPAQGTPGALPTRSSPIALPDVNFVGLAAFFMLGVCGMLVALLFVGVLLFARRMG